MNALHSLTRRATALLTVALIGVPGIFGTAFAGDITQYANTTWLRGGYVWGTTEIVGCKPADPDGTACAFSDRTEPLDDPPWTFEAGPGGAALTVVDAYLATEQYAVYDHDVLVGYTSEPPDEYLVCGEDPGFCLDSGASQGVFELGPGPHSITMEELTETQMTGVVFMRVDGDLGIVDSDGDGVADDVDACPESDLSPTVVINECDSTVTNQVLTDGCTIMDLVADCFEANTRTGRAYRCVKDTASALYNTGIIDWAERRLLRQCN